MSRTSAVEVRIQAMSPAYMERPRGVNGEAPAGSGAGTYVVVDIEVLSERVTSGISLAIVRYENGIVQFGEIRSIDCRRHDGR